MADIEIIAQYQTVTQATNAIENLGNTATRTGNTALATGRKMNAMGVGIQQAGYQIGDFLVQIQSGTNWMVAFGQQATQLVGILPMFRSVMGLSGNALIGLSAGLGIAIPLVTAIGAAIMRTSNNAEESTKAFDALKDAVSDYRSALETLESSQADLEERFGRFVDVAGRAAEYLRRSALLEINQQVSELANNFGNVSRMIGRMDSAITADLRDFLGVSSMASGRSAVADFANALRNLGTADGIDAQISAAENLRDTIFRISGDYESLNEEQKAFVDRLNLSIQELATMGRTQFEDLERGLDWFDQYMEDFVSGHQEVVDSLLEQQRLQREQAERQREITRETMRSASAAGQLATQYGVSLQTASRLVGVLSNLAQNREVILDPRDPRYNRTRATMARLRAEAGTTSPFARTPPVEIGGGGRELESLYDYLRSLREEADFRRSLVGVSEEQVTQMERERQLRDMIAQATGVELELGDSRLQQLVQMEAQTRQLMQREQQRMALQRSFEQTIENGLMSMVEGAASVEDAFKGMIRNILIEIVRQQFMEPLSKNIASGLMGLLGFANGGAFSGGRVMPFANGGVVSSPTMFPMRGGTGLMGEAGPEAIMPLKRTSSGKLGVVAEGNGNVVVNQTFHFQANGDESVRRIIAESAPKIAQMTQKQLLDSRRRGGTMKAAFR